MWLIFGYVLLLYLFLKFQIDKIRDPKHPNKRNPFKERIKKIKESVK